MSENRHGENIGGIPLPEKFPKIVKSTKEFTVFQHRGFGEKALARYDKTKLGLTSMHNTITGLEIAVDAGADAIEVDLMRAKDGQLVLNHPTLPTQKEIDMSLDKFLEDRPEALTYTELLDWLSHQDTRLKIHLELKSDIDFGLIIDEINKIDTEGKYHLKKRIMLYGSDTKRITGFLKNKKECGLKTEELKLWWITNGIVSKDSINKVAGLGENDCQIYGIEQGMMPWGTNQMVETLPTFMGGLEGKLSDIVDYAHEKGLKLITGTVNKPNMIHWLIKQGVDGIVPDNIVDFEAAGLERPVYESPIKLANDPDNTGKRYLPSSMKKRLGIN